MPILSVLRRRHFIGVSANPEKMDRVGYCSGEYALCLWDWVGGRFSLWSAIGLPVAIADWHGAFSRATGRRAVHGPSFCRDAFARQPAGAVGHDGGMECLVSWIFALMRVLPYDARLREFPGYLGAAGNGE
jgi:glucose-6-phosphate isomerase